MLPLDVHILLVSQDVCLCSPSARGSSTSLGYPNGAKNYPLSRHGLSLISTADRVFRIVPHLIKPDMGANLAEVLGHAHLTSESLQAMYGTRVQTCRLPEIDAQILVDMSP